MRTEPIKLRPEQPLRGGDADRRVGEQPGGVDLHDGGAVVTEVTDDARPRRCRRAEPPLELGERLIPRVIRRAERRDGERGPFHPSVVSDEWQHELERL